VSDYPEAPSPEGLRRALLAMLGGLSTGDTLRGWRLLHVDVDEALSYVFERPGHRLEIALGPRDDSHRHFAQTRSFNVSYYVARLPGRALSDEGQSLVRAVVERLQANDTGDGKKRLQAAVPATGRGDIRTTRVETMLAPTTIDGASYYTANPYLGCLIGCGFCYAQARVGMTRRLLGLEDLEWGRYVVAKENAAEVLDRELTTLEKRPVVFSPLVADVYQSVERRLEITRRCLAVIARHGVRTYVLTRATLVLRDVDLFQQIPDATVGFSVPTDRDETARAYEPRAAPIRQRLEALATLRKAGIRTVAVVQPILAMDPVRLASRLADVCDAVRVDVYLAADVGGTRLRPVGGEGPAPPTPDEERRLQQTLIEELSRRGVTLWTTHVPP
jgi:DNA repair photolyase